MLPLYMADTGNDASIIRISGNDQVKRHLETMGFVVGEPLKVVARIEGNVIVKIKGVSVALSRDLAKRIYV